MMLVEGANIGHGGASRSMFLSRKFPEVGRYWVFKSYTGNVAKLLSRLEYVWLHIYTDRPLGF